MKTLFTLLTIFSLFYFASSCKKGDTGNSPGIDSTHYYDSVKHVTDSIKHVTDSAAHVADSIYKLPWGIYYGDIHYQYRDNGNMGVTDMTDTFIVSKIGLDSISIAAVIGYGILRHTFLISSNNHYTYGSSYNASASNGTLYIHQHDEIQGDYDDYVFGGIKKK